MTDTTPSSPSTSVGTTRAGATTVRTGRLSTDKGTTTIADVVVTKIAGIAAREVGGVHRLGGAVARALGAVTQRLPASASAGQGVSVEVSEGEARVTLSVIVDYGESIPDVSEGIRDNVIRRIEATTGLAVTAVDIAISDLYFPGDDDEDLASAGPA